MSSTYSLAGGIVDNTPYQAEVDGVPYLQQTDCLLPGAWPAEADRVPYLQPVSYTHLTLPTIVGV